MVVTTPALGPLDTGRVVALPLEPLAGKGRLPQILALFERTTCDTLTLTGSLLPNLLQAIRNQVKPS